MARLASHPSRRDDADMQMLLFGEGSRVEIVPFTTGLLKWIGNKQRMAHEIASYFPSDFGVYFEPFLGSAAVLGTLQPRRAIGSDAFAPLIEIWQTLHSDPAKLKRWYADRYRRMMDGDKVAEYERVKSSYNKNPN